MHSHASLSPLENKPDLDRAIDGALSSSTTGTDSIGAFAQSVNALSFNAPNSALGSAELSASSGSLATDLSTTDRFADLLKSTGKELAFSPSFDTDFPAVNPNGIGTVSGNPVEAIFPLSETFELHSNESSTYKVYLDFDGHVTENTLWNDFYGDSIVSPAYDRDGDNTTFSDDELDQIQRIWARVAEDFAPFNVDVTTEDPGVAGLSKSNAGDQTYGVRNVITVDDFADCFCGGFAFLNTFADVIDTPVFVFNGGEIPAAETVSHETGHALGLVHDGVGPVEYYRGHPARGDYWGAIMGAIFQEAVTTWSRGDYFDASNTEDDLQIITTQNGIRYRNDDHSNSLATATGLTGAPVAGVIERNTDVDWFSFNASADSPVTIGIDGAAIGGNLNLWAGIYDSAGGFLFESNDLNSLSASFNNLRLNESTYYLRVEGIGSHGVYNTFFDQVRDPIPAPYNQAGPDGYSDYGSLGVYTVSINGLSTGTSSDVYYRYTGAQTAYSFENIKATGRPILAQVDDGSFQLSDAALGSFAFDFYGTRYDSLYVSSNGLVSFGAAVDGAGNGSLTDESSQPVIAAFWDDLVNTGEILWDVRGSGEDQRLIIQWDKVSHQSVSGNITFQVVLSQADDSITVNYRDAIFESASADNGASATLGIKGSGDQSAGRNRLLMSYNDTTKGFIGDGRSVRFDYDQAFLDGTDANDQLLLRAGPTQHVVELNGERFLLDSRVVTKFNIDAKNGQDKINLYGTFEDELFRARPGSIDFSGSNFNFRGQDIEIVRGDGNGGYDKGYIHGTSASGETFDVTGDYSRLTGAGFDNQLFDIDITRGYSEGGSDTANLHDSRGNDRFVGRDGKSLIASGNYRGEALGFETVIAHSRGGFDIAQLIGTAGRDVLDAHSSISSLTGTGYSFEARRFDRVYAYGNGGSDSAQLYDSRSNDRFYGYTNRAIMAGSKFYYQVRDFANVQAYASGGADLAFLRDSAGNDVFNGDEDVATLSGRGFSNEVNAFDRVYAYSTGGTDTAYMYDSIGNDQLYSWTHTTQFYGTRFFSQVSRFDRVHAYSRNGSDRAFMFGSSRDDRLSASGRAGSLSGTGYLNAFDGFSVVAAHGYGGRNRISTSNLQFKLSAYVFNG